MSVNLKVSCGALKGVWKMSGRCLDGVWKFFSPSGRCPKCVQEVGKVFEILGPKQFLKTKMSVIFLKTCLF